MPNLQAHIGLAHRAAQRLGHPLLDIMILTMSRDEVFKAFEFDPKKKLIGLLPGSRKREVESLLPAMLEAAEKIEAENPQVQFVLPRASTVRAEIVDHIGRFQSKFA